MSYVPFETRKAIVRLYFEGNLRKKIAKQMGVSTGTVSNAVSEFVERANLVGLDSASREYGLESLLESLHGLMSTLSKKKLTLGQAIDAVPMAEAFVAAGLSKDDAEPFLRKLVKQQGKYPVEVQVRCAEELNDLEQQSGKSYPELIEDFKAKEGEHGQLLEAVEDGRKKKAAVEADVDKALLDADVTRTELKEYVSTRKSLKASGVDMDDLNKLGRAATGIKEKGFDVPTVLGRYGEEVSIDERMHRKESDFKALESKCNIFAAKADEVQGYLREYEELRSYGLNKELLRMMAETARKHPDSTNFGVDVLKAYERYGGILGLQGEYSRVQSEVERIKAEEARAIEASKLTGVSIEATKDLIKHGVPSNDIIMIDGLVRRFGPVDAPEAVRRLGTLNELAAAIEDWQIKKKEAERQTKEEQGRVTSLREEFAVLVSELGQLKVAYAQAIRDARTFVDSMKEGYMAQSREIAEAYVEAGRKLQELLDKVESRKQFKDLADFLASPVEAKREFVIAFSKLYITALIKWVKEAKESKKPPFIASSLERMLNELDRSF